MEDNRKLYSKNKNDNNNASLLFQNKKVYQSKSYYFEGSTEPLKTNITQDDSNASILFNKVNIQSNNKKDKKEPYINTILTKLDWDNSEKDVERDWYTQEETATIDNIDKSSYGNFNQNDKTFDLERKRLLNPISKRTINNMDANKWEINQLKNSGIIKENSNDNNLEIEDINRVVIQATDVRPPFLDNNVELISQNDYLQMTNNDKSEMMKLAKNGSAVLKELRERNERGKMKEKFNQLNDPNNSKTGEVISKNSEIPTIGDQENNLIIQNSTNTIKKTMKEQREYLPIFSVKKELMNVIRDNKIVIIVGETGSGKTTQLTQYLYEENISVNGIIGCTQPRRVAAVSVAKRVSEEMNCQVSDIVGYTIRFEDLTSKATKIKYMTDGVLLRESLTDPYLDKYSAIIMDEAHERSLNTDVLFGILRKVIENRRDLKLIVTSATMNAGKFSNFFGNAPVFTIPGRTYKVDIIYSKSLCEDYVDSAVIKALTVHIQYGEGDILIFMTGQEDIEATCLLLQEKIEKDKNIPQLLILPIYSQLPSDMQSKIFEKSNTRKCIVATNIAETSLTLDGVKYVIDTGFNKVKLYNPKVGMDVLQINPISQANANQRAGRAGRTGPGVCFRLYTEIAYKLDLLENNIPEIQRTNLNNVVLLLKSLNIDNILSFNFMDPPPQETILSSMYQLWMLGALDGTGVLTPLGRKMVEFPLDPTMSKILISSERYGCSSEILSIVSMLSIQTIFYRPKDKETESDRARERFFIGESDHLTLLNIYQQWKANKNSNEWAMRNYLQGKSLKKVDEIRKQLCDIMIQQKVPIVSCGKNYELIRKTIATGFFHNCAKLRGIGEYVNLRSSIPCVLHPSSSIYSLGYTPDYVVYHELIMTKKEYMSCVTIIEPEWLIEIAPLLFSIKSVDKEERQKNDEYKDELMKIETKMREIIQRKRLNDIGNDNLYGKSNIEASKRSQNIITVSTPSIRKSYYNKRLTNTPYTNTNTNTDLDLNNDKDIFD